MKRTGKYDRLLRNSDKLKKVCKLKTDKSRNKFVSKADNDFIACLVECSANILRGKVPLKAKQKKELGKHLKFLRNISKDRKVDSTRHKLGQAGGFLPALIIPVLTALAVTTVSEIASRLL